ncbi:MAG: hypothetical protein Q7J47_10975 [Azoarcus sp.]|nr:hypothetical protein [Azoarcus sp.]
MPEQSVQILSGITERLLRRADMIYLISRSICQGCKAGAIALVGVIAAPLVDGALLAQKPTDDVESGALHPSLT